MDDIERIVSALANRQSGDVVRQPGFAAFDQALKQYPILGNMGLSFASSMQKPGILEYWPSDEEGASDWPRPDELPMGSTGIEATDPNMRPIDVLGDVASHGLVNTDPQMKDYYAQFVSSMTPEQESRLQEQYSYAQEHEGEQRPFEEWASMTGLPGYFRGYPFKQWNNAEGMYTPEQLQMLDEMMKYLEQ